MFTCLNGPQQFKFSANKRALHTCYREPSACFRHVRKRRKLSRDLGAYASQTSRHAPEKFFESVKWDSSGLVPVIVQVRALTFCEALLTPNEEELNTSLLFPVVLALSEGII